MHTFSPTYLLLLPLCSKYLQSICWSIIVSNYYQIPYLYMPVILSGQCNLCCLNPHVQVVVLSLYIARADPGFWKGRVPIKFSPLFMKIGGPPKSPPPPPPHTHTSRPSLIRPLYKPYHITSFPLPFRNSISSVVKLVIDIDLTLCGGFNPRLKRDKIKH